MANPSVTYTFVNSTTANATEVNTNFNDLINSLTDGTKSLTIDALTAGGAATLNGHVTLGNGTPDDITINGSLASTIPIKITNTYNIGSSTLGLLSVYFGSSGGAFTTRVIGAAVASSYTLTLPLTVGTAGQFLQVNGSGVTTFASPRMISTTNNLGLASGTTSVAGDSIKITSANGSALSSSNAAIIVIPGATAGESTIFSITADVTINLTGAHWGFGTKGDLTDYFLSVYAINDAGTLKWGVGAIPNHHTILDADDSATATDINLIDEILVNSALTGDSKCLEIGYFKANFDDTGGSSEDLWNVQTGQNDLNLGPFPAIPKSVILVSTWTSNAATSAQFVRSGAFMEMSILVGATGTPTSANLDVSMPTGLVINTARMASAKAYGTPLGAATFADNSAGANYSATANYKDTSTIAMLCEVASGSYTFYTYITQAVPVTVAVDDQVGAFIKVPIVGWD